MSQEQTHVTNILNDNNTKLMCITAIYGKLSDKIKVNIKVYHLLDAGDKLVYDGDNLSIAIDRFNELK